MVDGKPSVRLSAREIEVIRATVERLIGSACLRVFGSRAREEEKGGDIDLLIETGRNLESRIATECRVASELQILLGDQKIDVIIVDPETAEQPIHKIARQTGVII